MASQGIPAGRRYLGETRRASQVIFLMPIHSKREIGRVGYAQLCRGRVRHVTRSIVSGVRPHVGEGSNSVLRRCRLQCPNYPKADIGRVSPRCNSGDCRHSRNGRYGTLDRVTASVRLDVEGPDDVAPRSAAQQRSRPDAEIAFGGEVSFLNLPLASQ
jgi:hypothetical protein